MPVKHTLLPALAALSLAAIPAAHAQTYTEIGDAGQTVATAQNASTATFTKINGTIAPTADDADLYRIYISSPSTFSATTVNTVTDAGGVDTELFLFDATGHAIAANDDDPARAAFANGTDSTLPVGNPLYKSLPAGYYILGISSSENEPTNGPPPNQLLFASGMGVRGPASGLNPTTLGGFDLQEYDTNTTGAYEIDFTGVSAAPAAAPEPSQLAALAVGLLGLGALAIKARRRTA